MAILDVIGASAAASGTGRADAYVRLLHWEASMTHRHGASRLQRYREAFEYYTGENTDDNENAQPLEINYLRATCEAHASYLWGQWEQQGRLINFAIKPRNSKGDKEKLATIEEWVYQLFEGHEELFYAAGLNQSIYGDCILRPRWSELYERVEPESVLPEYFHARWSAHDVSDIREVVISYPISRDEAYREYGTRGDTSWATAQSGFAVNNAIYWEYWTVEAVEYWIDNVQIKVERNETAKIVDGELLPGIIPFVHIPNVRSGGEFYGSSDIESVLNLQDELNRKMADAGDIIAYSAHPIVLVRKYFGKVDHLPTSPDAIWDMGREGEAEYLSGDPPPVDIAKYIDDVMAMFQDLSYMPAAAFGRSETSQASALTLAMEMMPVTQRVTWKRMFWKQGIVRYIHFAARIAEKHGVLPFSRRDLNKYLIDPSFSPILPKDRASTINENVQLVTNGLRDTKSALDDLGVRDSETATEAIFTDLKRRVDIGMQVQLGGKNARGPGGSPDMGSQARDNKAIKSEGS